jgi:hypothetical protein
MFCKANLEMRSIVFSTQDVARRDVKRRPFLELLLYFLVVDHIWRSRSGLRFVGQERPSVGWHQQFPWIQAQRTIYVNLGLDQKRGVVRALLKISHLQVTCQIFNTLHRL